MNYQMLTDHPEFQALLKLPRDPDIPYPGGSIDDINSYRIWFVDADQPSALFMPYNPLRKDVIQTMFDNISLGECQHVHFRYMGAEYNTNCLKDPNKRKQVFEKLIQDFINFCKTSGINTTTQELCTFGEISKEQYIFGKPSNNHSNVYISFKELTEDGIIQLYSSL